MEFGLFLPVSGRSATRKTLREYAQLAEGLGFHQLWAAERIVIPWTIDTAYPYAEGATFIVPPDRPFLESLTVLAFLAGCTERMKLGVSVLVLPYRHPLHWAKVAATIDVLSEGRFTLGVGVGWMKEEFDALNAPFAERGRVSDEQLQMLRGALTEERCTFDGKHYKFKDIAFNPKGFNRDRVPIWVGGEGLAAQRRAARYGDAWFPYFLRITPEELSNRWANVRKQAEALGRDPSEIELNLNLPICVTEESVPQVPGVLRGTPQQLAAAIEPLQKIGVRHLALQFMVPHYPERLVQIQRFAEAIARMRTLIVGGGPGGLYLAILLKKALPDALVEVIERNTPDATFGFGVVFSDETLGYLQDNDEPTFREITATFNRWDAIEIRHRDQVRLSRGHGFSGIARKRLLEILQQRCGMVGVSLDFMREFEPRDVPDFAQQYDLIVAADGANSRIRTHFADVFMPEIDVRRNKYAWFGTTQRFENFLFSFRPTEYGMFWCHAYRYDLQNATFIVECDPDTWRASGLDQMSEEESARFCERVFANDLRGAATAAQPLDVDQLSYAAHRQLVPERRTGQRGAARRRGPHRPLQHRLRHQAGDGGRHRAGVLPGVRAANRGCAGGVRAGAQTGSGPLPTRRIREPVLVRGRPALRRLRRGPVRIQPADPLAPHLVRDVEGA